jgi:hypothetical protein
MSFLRHEGIYRSDDFCVAGSEPLASLPALIGLDEFPAGYSLTGCSPAEPASASPTATDSQQSTLPYNAFSANGDNPLNLVSQPKGALHILPFPCTSSANGKGETRGKSVRDPPGLKCQGCPRLFTTTFQSCGGLAVCAMATQPVFCCCHTVIIRIGVFGSAFPFPEPRTVML